MGEKTTADMHNEAFLCLLYTYIYILTDSNTIYIELSFFEGD